MADKKRQFPKSIHIYWGEGTRASDDYLMIEENGLDGLSDNVDDGEEVAIYELKFIGKLVKTPTLVPVK